mmetsp:Transcript_54149/g.99031  ORF Transcript_54149/g.99031 Transcript_54149/m.99031 type:complete len:247 (-) Transcript_54149:1132-1872(-)
MTVGVAIFTSYDCCLAIPVVFDDTALQMLRNSSALLIELQLVFGHQRLPGTHQQILEALVAEILSREVLQRLLPMPYQHDDLICAQPLLDGAVILIIASALFTGAFRVDHQILHFQLLLLPVQQLLFHAPLLNELVNCNLAVLTNPMCSVNSLMVDMWVPILIKEHDVVGTCEINAKSPSARADQVHEVILVLAVEVAHVQFPQHPARVPVETQTSPTTKIAKLLQNVKRRAELREDENLVRLRRV